ncbi:putative chemokine-like factor superfamily 4, partial [Operophtera brumata]
MIAFWFTGILLGFYLFHIVEKFYRIPWLRIEFVFCALWTCLYLLASILAATVRDNPHSAACVSYRLALLPFIVLCAVDLPLPAGVHPGGYRPRQSALGRLPFWFTGILLGFYLFHIVEKFYRIPWLRIEFVFCALWTCLYLLASILAATVRDNPHSAACFFGFVSTFAYAADCFLKWRGVRAGGLAQGARVVSKQTTAT